MLDYNRFELSFCIGSLDGWCLRRAAQLGLAVETAVSSCPGKGAKLAGLIAPGHDLRCLLVQGLHCPHAPPKPSFEYPVLKVGGEVVRRFKRHCKQTELLEKFESLGWPYSIVNPFGSPALVGPNNGIRDIVYHLNSQQHSRLQIHFWCDGDAVRWEIVGRLPPQQMAVPMPNHRVSPD
jgi:hypothetical protein